jgi:hypothetical protein
MPLLAEIAPEYLLFGAAGVVSLVAFGALIVTPAIGAFGRGWEKAMVGMLSLFVLAALVALGIGIGVTIVYYWNDISGLF